MHTADYEEPGKWSALLLAVLMHGLLAIALLVSVKWQTRPQPVVAELWTPRDMPPISEPAPPEPPPAIEPPPPIEAPAPVPPPVPEVEPPRPAPPPPEIKLKADKKPDKKAKKPPKPTPPETKKPVKGFAFDDLLAREETQLDRRKIDLDRQRRLDEESRLLKQAREDQESQQRSAARAKSQADYESRIKGKIRGNLVQPPNLKGNPIALFVVTQLPSGEILEVKLRRSSGNAQYDDAVERAIHKSSPLPRPNDPSLFARDLALTFCPDEERGCTR